MMRDCGKVVIVFALVINGLVALQVEELFKFNADPPSITPSELQTLRAIPESSYQSAISMGLSSFNNIQNLENGLSNRGISVQNGSISHKQLIDTLPNKKAQETNILARKILKASLYIYNTECIQKDISPEACAQYLSNVSLPAGPDGLLSDCAQLISMRKDGNHVFRRLLPSNYKDGFYAMNDKLPSPREISDSAFHDHPASNKDEKHDEDRNGKNLAFVQWTQFIEHDLSKPVASSLRDGQPINCCTDDYSAPAPRDLHPDCAPLYKESTFSKLGKESCLNYVRSALSIDGCHFGPAQQLNQATGYLDLSQLYGFTKKTQRRMRAMHGGKLKTSDDDLLPLAPEEDRNSFCAIKPESNEICFMAGDTRVNSNPSSIILYTIFMRSHNHFADEIKVAHPNWSDDNIYRAAKRLNIDLYRQVVFNEWLSAALGNYVSAKINSEPLIRADEESDYEVSNEFAVAAIRFYFSMMPNILQRQEASLNNEISTDASNRSEADSAALYKLMDQMFRSEALDRSSKLNEFLASMLNQKARRMDATYAGSLIEEYTKSRIPSRTNVLAFDIQRGRDHGFPGYTKYFEKCMKQPMKTWENLADFVYPFYMTKLRSVYDNVTDIDLMVGGISEIPLAGSTVGPTFTCILGEQFAKIRQWHYNLHSDQPEFDSQFRNVTAAKLLCANTELLEVPVNIFLLTSYDNPLVRCSDVLRS